MKALFLTDAEMDALIKILKAGVVSGGSNFQPWQRKSIAGPECNYVHGKLMEMCRSSFMKKFDEDKRRAMAVRRERRAAMKLAKQAFNL